MCRCRDPDSCCYNIDSDYTLVFVVLAVIIIPIALFQATIDIVDPTFRTRWKPVPLLKYDHPNTHWRVGSFKDGYFRPVGSVRLWTTNPKENYLITLTNELEEVTNQQWMKYLGRYSHVMKACVDDPYRHHFGSMSFVFGDILSLAFTSGPGKNTTSTLYFNKDVVWSYSILLWGDGLVSTCIDDVYGMAREWPHNEININ